MSDLISGWCNVILLIPEGRNISLGRDGRPDAILLDVIMPGMAGVAFVRELQANPELQAIPVVFHNR
jgi:putative two-component system response regulator